MSKWDDLQKSKQIARDYYASQNPKPRCPLCGSENIRRISTTEKIGSTMAFGFFGNKRKQQFECLNPNCGYRW